MSGYTSFVEYWQLISPPWLRGPWGSKLIGVFGAMQDEVQAKLKQGVKSRFPNTCTIDALTRIGHDRGMPKWDSSESWTDYRARLVAAWDLWQQAGTDKGILKALSWVGFQDCSNYPTFNPKDAGYTVDHAQTVFVVTANDYDAASRPDYPCTWWNVFWIFADPTVNTLPPDTKTWDTSTGWNTWGTGLGANNWDDAGVWDFDVPKSRVDNIRAAIRTWKPAHMLCPYIFVTSSLSNVWGGLGDVWTDSADDAWDDSEALKLAIGEPL